MQYVEIIDKDHKLFGRITVMVKLPNQGNLVVKFGDTKYAVKSSQCNVIGR